MAQLGLRALGVAVTESGKVAVLAISPSLEKKENISTNVIVVEGEFDGLTSFEILQIKFPTML